MEQLKRLRTERGLTQVKLAVRADIDPSTLNQIEGGRREPSPATLRKLAEALDVSIAELLGDAPKGQRRSPYEPSFNDVLAAERRIDFAAVAGALDHFSGYWWGAVTQGRSLDLQQLAEFAESVRTLALMVRELSRAEREQLGVRGKWTAADRERSALWPSIQRFVAVVQQVPDLAEDRDAAVAVEHDALEPIAA